MERQSRQQTRYRATVALLDDTAALAQLARAAAGVVASEEPCAVALAGGRRLSAARRVGMFAGSFNPLTRAHVALVNAARHGAGLDTIIWVCAAASVDKERVERAALVDRLAQMRAFLARRRGEALALLNRGLYVDEAKSIRGLLPSSAALHILVGYDKIVQIFDPKYYRDRDAALRALFALADILVAPRDGEGAEALAALLAQPENQRFAGHVRYLEVPDTWGRDSSTEARMLAAQTPPDRAALSRLLPPAGEALALATDAYQGSHPDGGQNTDPYAARARWLDALATLPPSLARELPPLSTLVRRTLAADAGGKGLRAWLADEQHTDDALVLLLRDHASG